MVLPARLSSTPEETCRPKVGAPGAAPDPPSCVSTQALADLDRDASRLVAEETRSRRLDAPQEHGRPAHVSSATLETLAGI